MHASITTNQQEIDDIILHTVKAEKYWPNYGIDMVDGSQQLIAKDKKTLYIGKTIGANQ